VEQPAVLIVDDDPNVLELLRVNLRAQGYDVTAASNGTEALAAIERQTPRLMVLDVMMPEMDGWEVCKQVRDRFRDSVKIVMLTAKDTARDRIIGKDILKADEYLTKPFDIDELLATVRRLVG